MKANLILTLTVLLSGFISLISTYSIRSAALHFNWLDRPGGGKIHANPVPLLGGVGIYVGFLIAFLITNSQTILQQSSAILAGSTLITITGLYDDLRGMKPLPKLVAQILAAGALINGGIYAQVTGIYLLDLAITIFWVVGICNAQNLLDNMDGLSAGVAAIACFFFTLLAVSQGQVIIAAVSAALLGATLGFLRFNWHPATIFMGDTGSLLLGFLLASLGIQLRFPGDLILRTWMIPILVLAVPIFDTTLVSISRLRRGLRLTDGGRDHVSHRLRKMGLGVRQSVGAIYFASIFCGTLALPIALIHNTGLAYILTAIVVFIGLALLFILERVDLSDTGQPQRQ
ncbi:MraY family glycosyltransferase [Spirulina sp. 06S082]|uniref:MraY family glycosyltransferase n=1 Tax=Spirulina sp. 06S082 TaxID=3110248 RepID=UPI002B2036D9|nr:MraY family glycosyltransferase [Spirulina sp. 06S082]MEA5470676.1 MraY family glycosyltransferase [Spirulina sp. 06S082]